MRVFNFFFFIFLHLTNHYGCKIGRQNPLDMLASLSCICNYQQPFNARPLIQAQTTTQICYGGFRMLAAHQCAGVSHLPCSWEFFFYFLIYVHTLRHTTSVHRSVINFQVCLSKASYLFYFIYFICCFLFWADRLAAYLVSTPYQ